MNGNDTTAIKIVAVDEMEALTKAYSYFCGDSRLTIEDFRVLSENTECGNVYRLFKDFTGQTILYFGTVGEYELIDDLEVVDIIKCR